MPEKSREKVTIKVSPRYLELRRTSTNLNQFVWSTIGGYGHILSEARPPLPFSDPSREIQEVIGKVTAREVWYPNNKGESRLSGPTSEFLKQIQNNGPLVYRAALIYFHAAFELYLDARVPHLRPTKRDGKELGWGPYLRSLAPLAVEAGVNVGLLICADFCRTFRNHAAHQSSRPMPHTIEDKKIKGWVPSVLAARVDDELIASVKKYFFGEPDKASSKSVRDYFFMLYTLSNLDKLAIQIEQARPPTYSVLTIEQDKKQEFPYLSP